MNSANEANIFNHENGEAAVEVQDAEAAGAAQLGEEVFSRPEQIILTALPMFASALSLLASIAIIHVIWFKRKERLGRVYHRYIFIMSILDVISSTNALFSSFMIPVGTPDVFWAFGDTATCTVSGFLWQTSFVVPIYSACLSFYFLLQVRYQMKDVFYAKWIEPCVHLLCIIYIVTSGSLGIAWSVFNPSQTVTGWCFASDYPWGCLDDADMECRRGENYSLFGHIFFSFVFMLVMVSLIFNMTALYCTVRNQEKRLRRHSVTARNMKLSQKVGKRALRFVGAFLFTFIWPPIVQSTVNNIHGPGRFVLVLMEKCFLPLQGFWNFLIYIGPYVQDFKDAYASSVKSGFFTSTPPALHSNISTDSFGEFEVDQKAAVAA